MFDSDAFIQHQHHHWFWLVVVVCASQTDGPLLLVSYLATFYLSLSPLSTSAWMASSRTQICCMQPTIKGIVRLNTLERSPRYLASMWWWGFCALSLSVAFSDSVKQIKVNSMSFNVYVYDTFHLMNEGGYIIILNFTCLSGSPHPLPLKKFVLFFGWRP